MKKIVFQSQMGFVGQIPRTHTNMRVEFAQMCALQIDHYPLFNIDNIPNKYDVAVLLIPKTPADRDKLYDIGIAELEVVGVSWVADIVIDQAMNYIA